MWKSCSIRQAYSGYQSNWSKISTIDDTFMEMFAVINHGFVSFFKKYFHCLKINSGWLNFPFRLIFADEFFEYLTFLTQILEQSDFTSIVYIWNFYLVIFAMISSFSTEFRFNADKTYLAKLKRNRRNMNRKRVSAKIKHMKSNLAKINLREN